MILLQEDSEQLAGVCWVALVFELLVHSLAVQKAASLVCTKRRVKKDVLLTAVV